MKLKNNRILSIVLALAVILTAVFGLSMLSDASEMTIESIMHPINGTEKDFSVEIENVSESGILIAGLYSSADKFLAMQTMPVAAGTTKYTVSFTDISSADYIKLFVWDSLSGMKPLSAVTSAKLAEISAQPDETVTINNAEKEYKSGETVELDMTYTVGKTVTEINDENVVIIVENDDTAEVTRNGMNLTVSGYGEVTVTAYPANFADAAEKVVTYEFTVTDETLTITNETGKTYKAGDVVEMTFSYTVDGQITEAAAENVAVEAKTTSGTAVVSVNGHAVTVESGYGEVEVTAYPVNFAGRKAVYTFSVVEKSAAVSTEKEVYKSGESAGLVIEYTVNGVTAAPADGDVVLSVSCAETAAAELNGTSVAVSGYGEVTVTAYPTGYEDKKVTHTFKVTEEKLTISADKAEYTTGDTAVLNVEYTVDGEQTAVTTDKVTFEGADVAVEDGVVSAVLNTAGTIVIKAYPAAFPSNGGEITLTVTDPAPVEEVILNYSDEFMYRFGTNNTIPLDITYTVGGEETAITADNVKFEFETVMGNITANTVAVTSGTPYMTLGGGGQVKMTVYPTNAPENKKEMTFEVLEDYYNISSANTTGLGNNFCLVSDLTNKTFTLAANKRGYGNNYTINNAAYSGLGHYGSLVTLHEGAILDNIQIIGHPITVMADKTADAADTYRTVYLHNNAMLTNSYVQYGQSGIFVAGSGTVIENVTVHNAFRSINMIESSGTTLKEVTIDQYRTEEDKEYGNGIGGAVIIQDASAKINIDGNVYFHSFVTLDDTNEMDSNVGGAVKQAFSESDIVFDYEGTEYVNPAIITMNGSVDLTVSDNSNFADYVKVDKTVMTIDTSIYTYNNTIDIKEYADLFSGAGEYKSAAGKEQIPYALTLPSVEPIVISNGAVTHNYANGVKFRKYAEDLEYTVSAEAADGTALADGEAVFDTVNKTVTFNIDEAKAYNVIYTVTDKFKNTASEHKVTINTVEPTARTPVIVFASPTDEGTGADSSTNVFDVFGYKTGWLLDYDYNMGIDVWYGVKAFDYKGEDITESVSASVNATSATSSTKTIADDGYFTTNMDNLPSTSYSTVSIKYSVTDSYGNKTEAVRHYQISNSSSSWIKTKDFASRNSFKTLSIAWDGTWSDAGEPSNISVTYNSSASTNYVVSGGAMVE